MTKEEIIKEGRPFEPNCFETDNEELWYEIGLYDGATAEEDSPWISVADELPPFGQEVYVYSIFYSRFGEWKTKRYKNHVDEYGYKTQEDEYGFDTRKAPYYSPNMQITHWRPMPPFPEN